MESDRIKLVAPSMEYQPLMLEAIQESQEELGQFLPWVPYALTEETSIKNTQQSIENFKNFEDELRYLIFDKALDHFIGVISLRIRDKAIPFFEIGYWLRSSCVGSGYMTEAVKLIEQYAFNDLNAKRLEIQTAEANLKSRAIAERCGYQYEGTLLNDRILPSGEVASSAFYAKTSL